jgi:signal peptide peptidase SppA
MSTRKYAKPSAQALLDSMNMRAAMIAPHYNGLASTLREYAEADRGLEEAAWEVRKAELTTAYGFGETNNSKPFAFSNGVAIIPVHGTLLNRFSYSWGYVTGYNFIRQQHQAALEDDDVKLIVFDCNSYGGMAAGCFELADEIRASRSIKPSLAVVDSNSFSACYAIASSASKMVSTSSSGIGSIGVVAMHMNVGELMKDWGIEITFIYAGAHKVDGNPYNSLPDDVKANIQTSIDKSYDKFATLVSTNRNLSVEFVKSTEAACYDADDALELGLIDAIQSPSQAVATYLDELSGSNDDQQEFTMSKENTQPGAESNNQPVVDEQAVAAQARADERERMAGIMNCEEAAGKAKLANHLALNTDMSVDAAKAVLAAAAPEQAATAPAAASNENGFTRYMDADKHPQVGADSEAGDEHDHGQKQSNASRILASQAAATGRPLATKH